MYRSSFFLHSAVIPRPWIFVYIYHAPSHTKAIFSVQVCTLSPPTTGHMSSVSFMSRPCDENTRFFGKEVHLHTLTSSSGLFPASSSDQKRKTPAISGPNLDLLLTIGRRLLPSIRFLCCMFICSFASSLLSTTAPSNISHYLRTIA